MGAKCPTCGGRENVIVDGTSCQVRPDRFHREAREKFDREAAATPPATAHDGTCCANAAGMPNCHDPSPAPAPAEDRDIWQHDETGRIVELPAGSPSPGKRYFRVRGMGGRVSVVGEGDEARVVFTPDARPTPPAPDAAAMREACRVAAKAAAEHVDSSWRSGQDPTAWHPMRLPLVRAACDVGEAAAIRALPPAPVDAVERDAARFRWLMERNFGFAFDAERCGISTGRWGRWPEEPDEQRAMIDRAIAAEASSARDGKGGERA